MNETADDLITKVQQQLDEHRAWLRVEIAKTGDDIFKIDQAPVLILRVSEIRLRVVKVSGRVISVVYEYPDELVAFLRAETTPKHLRDSLAGGHVVDSNQRTFTATREVEP